MPFIAAVSQDVLDLPFEDELQHNMYNKDFK
ncbi:hypothetical protein T11_12558 [Trichinella zimbabwensis]|uniref:Uncharacterized protein n=1 Tax=Trichinella zimbabwensis TaxID=268475 RepID=A0A0V1G963_9BILA|nr:hypothetical protein T11_12558 [Trichinella zimbabwensis]